MCKIPINSQLIKDIHQNLLILLKYKESELSYYQEQIKQQHQPHIIEVIKQDIYRTYIEIGKLQTQVHELGYIIS